MKRHNLEKHFDTLSITDWLVVFVCNRNMCGLMKNLRGQQIAESFPLNAGQSL